MVISHTGQQLLQHIKIGGREESRVRSETHSAKKSKKRKDVLVFLREKEEL